MGSFVSGQVVVVRFPYSNLKQNIKRPALVLACTGSYSDLIVCMITATKRSSAPVDTDFSVEITDSDFVIGKLREAKSYVRPDRLVTVSATEVQKTVGNLEPKKMDQIMNQVALIFGFPKSRP